MTSELSAIRRRKYNIASVIPILTATTRSTNTVSEKIMGRITMSANGLLPSPRILVAVRAIAPVAAIPPNHGERILATLSLISFALECVVSIGHAVRNHCREQRPDRTDHSFHESGPCQIDQFINRPLWPCEYRQAPWNFTKSAPDSSHL